MRYGLLLIIFLVSIFSSNVKGAGWGDYWPITDENLVDNYTNAVNDLLSASAERYKLNYAMCGNTFQWNPWLYVRYEPGVGWIMTNQYERNFLIPYTVDLPGYTVTNVWPGYGVTNVYVIQNQTNLYAINDVSHMGYISAGLDAPRYALKQFDVQFGRIVAYPAYFGSAYYWLDWTKSGTNGDYRDYFDTMIVATNYSWATNWTVTISTSYPSMFPRFTSVGDYLSLVPSSNSPPV